MRRLGHTFLAFGLTGVLIASIQAAEQAGSMSSDPPSAASAVADSPQEVICKSGDNPLIPYYSWCGTGGVALDVIGNTALSGTFHISGIPPGASIVWARLYEACWWEPSPNVYASATFAGTTLPSVLPFDYDSTGAGGYVLCAYCWNVTSLVGGDGDYDYSISPLAGTWGEALVVVYSEASEPVRKIMVNHGAEALEHASSTTAFDSVEADSATLFVFTEADNSGGLEEVYFNDIVVAGPGDIFHGNMGYAASLLELGVECTAGINTVTVATKADYFGWHLAVLKTYGLAVKVTGGGWFVGGRAGSGSKKTFGFNVRSESGFCRGQLQFNDHSLGVKVHSDGLRSLSVYADTAASFTGSCSVNKTSGYSFECAVIDRGEPGRNADSFHLKIYDLEGNVYYSEGGLLGGGNIQIHVGGDHEATSDHSAPDGEPDTPQAPIPSVQHDMRGKNKVHTSLRNSPNPFCERTEISYCLSTPGRIVLDIFDVTGKHVESLVDEAQNAGTHTIRWRVGNRGCGVYFCKLRVYPERDGLAGGENQRAGEFIETRKMVVVD
jgi:hypothetical protein